MKSDVNVTQSWFQHWIASPSSQSQSSVSQINPVFGGSLMMLGANIQSVKSLSPMSVKSVSTWLSINNMYFYTYFLNFLYLVEESQCGCTCQFVLFHFQTEEERNRTMYPTTPCLKHALPDYIQVVVSKFMEREELRWSINTICCSSSYLCLPYLCTFVQTCDDVIVLFTLVLLLKQ